MATHSIYFSTAVSTSGGTSYAAWVDPANALTQDDVGSEVAGYNGVPNSTYTPLPSDRTDWLVLTGAIDTLPPGSTLTGNGYIRIRYRTSTSGPAVGIAPTLTRSGILTESTRVVSSTGALTQTSFGPLPSLVSVSGITLSDIQSDPTFGVAMRVLPGSSPLFYVDAMWLDVEGTFPSATTPPSGLQAMPAFGRIPDLNIHSI